ncbi:TIGR03619 family F420-dependent LLM class oxidoreductase [Mycolicibacterium chitae]|nr:TIGR03619 family F420-dependent LLM class oxidoreductase [Mycolicibacterium chitae]
MRFGVHVFLTEESMGAAEMATAVEDRGLDALWLPEHTHIPTSRRTPYPPGGELPDEYRRCVDPFIGLAVAAAVTSRIRLGAGVIQAALRDPIVTAKAVASLDLYSNGRVEVGVGVGWNEDEIADHGVNFTRRREVAREHVLAMQALWEHDEAEFHGEFVNFDSSWSWPKPQQTDGRGRRGVPVLLGGAAGPKLFSQIVEYGSGWMPLAGGGLTAGVQRLRELATAAGRDPDELAVIPFGSTPGHDKFDYFESLGIGEVIFNLPWGSRDVVLPALDRLAGFVAERRGTAA